MNSTSKKKKTIEQTAISFSSLLLLGYFLSLIAPLFYFFDLFSHFAIQYVIAGFVLGSILAFYKRWGWTSLNIIIAILCLIESRANLEYPYQLTAPKGQSVYKVASFNHNFGSIAYDYIENWAKENSNELDVIAFIEANAETKKLATNLAKLYPYQIHEPRNHAFGMVIISKYEFIESEKIPFKTSEYHGFIWNNFAVHLTIQDSEAIRPISIYVMHPPPPAGPKMLTQRNGEMQIIAEKVKNDPIDNIIVMGDLNNTPFSPSFRRFLEKSKLKLQSYGFIMNPTWPSFFFLPIFQIPIDHVLYSDNLIQQNKYVGPAIFSDHHAIIAEFSEKP